ncbi:MAG: hypothetical protein BWK80_56910 [Desulfobacteraceae bacterium IS3]|nr:MAG: hypothetical protein BWK80_56910 [Desulfobacteraceae bacterium IS3]
MGGVEAAEIIRKSCSENRNVPIIAMTANAMKGDCERYAAAGMNDYVAKPINPVRLAEAIRRQLGSGVRGSGYGVRGERQPLTPDPAPRTSVFDREDFLDRLGGNEEILESLVKDLPKHLSEVMMNLKTALKENNINDINLYAHTVKGMAANVSASRLSKAASEIEMSAKQGITDIPLSLTDRLEEEAEIFQSVLSDLFPDIFRYPEEPEPDEASDLSEQTKAALIRLLEDELIPKWKKYTELPFFEGIEIFAEELNHVGSEYQIDFLICYSLNLHNAAYSYDLDETEKLMSDFPAIVDRIRSMNKVTLPDNFLKSLC